MPVADKKKFHSKLLSKLSSLRSGAVRQDFLSRHKALLRSEFVTQLADLVVEKIRVNTAEALRVAEAALLIAQKLRRKDDLALALRAKANALYACGENRAAVLHHERAFQLFEELGERMQAARTQSSSIQPLILLGEYQRAFKAADQAREIFKDLGQTQRIASLENNVGNIFHRQDRFEEALAHYERAYQTLSEHGQWEKVAISLHNMAMCLISLNDFPRSLDC